ncbi:VOC family protein [Dankookia sp. P2]|uniref:VOC family protein n=1 Tax=Dankookia sp. P2 TaxID=3423955 RepID=UPI003D671931
MITSVKRLRHVRLATPDLERQVAYYRDIIGLAEVGREDGRAFLATEAGQLALVLEHGAEPRLAALALDVAPDLALAALERSLEDVGLRAERASDTAPGSETAIRFEDNEGRVVELHVGCHFHDNRSPLPGIAPLKVGHVAFYTRDPVAASRFYADQLGFRVSDWIEDRFVFLRCSHEHHTVNFTRGSDARMHHFAFKLRDAAHMHRAADVLGGQKVPILWGPVRHGPGHNVAMYHRDPDGNAVELFYDLDCMTDEALGFWDPRPWHRDRPQRPKTWVGLPRDVWGLPPSPAFLDMHRLQLPTDLT